MSEKHYLCKIMNLAGFLLKWRNALLVLMTALAVVCAAMIPKLNIIMEISYFLPDKSPIKIGMDKIGEELPNIDNQLSMMSVMFSEPIDKQAVMGELNTLTGGLTCLGIKEKGPHTLYQFILTKGYDYKACKQAIYQHFGDRAIVEVSLEKNMPADLFPMIALGATLVFVILLAMCSSFMEVLLFLITTAIAVAINMGSNILMDGISFLSFSLVAVLQMILSMDYSIILMNRFRQQKELCPDNVSAMEKAIKLAAPSILSSALTTIVSLLMLIFMKLKVGTDLGFVLAKGVFLSMVCNFTVLPALIITFDKAITKTAKKVPQVPATALAKFEIRYRYPLAALFIVLFIGAFILQKQTQIAFSSIWTTEIGEVFPPENPSVLVYETAEEDQVIGILDTLGRDPHVEYCLSYPGVMKKGYTALEMGEQISKLTSDFDPALLPILYYAYSHPERTEKLSFDQIQDLTDELSGQGMIPEGFDMDAITSKLMQPKIEQPAATEPAEEQIPQSPDTLLQAPAVPVDTLASSPMDSTLLASTDSLAAPQKEQATETAQEPQHAKITYEIATRQMSSKEIAEQLGIERAYINMVFRMAGRARKPATMSPHELSAFVTGKILTQKRYAAMLSKEQIALIREAHRQLDSAFIAGPAVSEPQTMLIAQADTLKAPADSTLLASADSVAAPAPVPGDAYAATAAAEPEVEEEIVVTPLERLAEMAFSGRKYSSKRVRSALAAAGVKVSQDDLDLLYLYAGSRSDNDPELRISIGDMVGFIKDSILPDPKFARFISEEQRAMLTDLEKQLDKGINSLRSPHLSMAVVMTDYEFESPETFSFVERFRELAKRSLKGEYYLVGESIMYKDIKDSFPNELILLTVLTIASIFIIVALTFKSLVIPVLLILAVMSGVYANVVASGLGGNTMYFMSYLIVQSILMGATIDYCILFMSYYRDYRKKCNVPHSIMAAYRGATHSILTSGLILIMAPFSMSLIISDKLVATILKCLASGALAAVLVIFLLLPAMIAICDPLIVPKPKGKSFGNK